MFQNADDVRNMSRKCGEGLFNGLFISDIGVNIMEQADLRAGMGRNVQPGLRHESQESDGFKGNGLATGIWTRDYHGICLGIQFDINRYYSCWIQ